MIKLSAEGVSKAEIGRKLGLLPQALIQAVNSKKKFQKEIGNATAAAAKSLQSCPTLCDPIDGSPPGSSIPGILQAKMLKWVAISFSNV